MPDIIDPIAVAVMALKLMVDELVFTTDERRADLLNAFLKVSQGSVRAMLGTLDNTPPRKRFAPFGTVPSRNVGVLFGRSDARGTTVNDTLREMTDDECAVRMSRFWPLTQRTSDADFGDTPPALQIRGDIGDLVTENASLQERVDWYEDEEQRIRALFSAAGYAFRGTIYDMVEALVDSVKGEF